VRSGQVGVMHSRLLVTGIVLMAVSGRVFYAVLTAARPGRVLLGDQLYEYWPLQPAECVLLGLGLGGTGTLLTAWFSPIRAILSRYLASMRPSVSALPVHQPAVRTGVNEPAGGLKASWSGACEDHHGI